MAPIGPQADHHEDDEPEHDAEHVAVRAQQCLLDGDAGDFFAAQFAAGFAQPLAEQVARGIQLVVAQRQVDVGVVVAELAEAHGEVEHQHAERPGKDGMCAQQQAMHGGDQHQRRRHGEQPGEAALRAFARIEVALEEFHIAGQPGVEVFARRQRVDLFQQQRGNQGKQAHGFNGGIKLGWEKDTTGTALHSNGSLENRSERFECKAHGAQKPEWYMGACVAGNGFRHRASPQSNRAVGLRGCLRDHARRHRVVGRLVDDDEAARRPVRGVAVEYQRLLDLERHMGDVVHVQLVGRMLLQRVHVHAVSRGARTGTSPCAWCA